MAKDALSTTLGHHYAIFDEIADDIVDAAAPDVFGQGIIPSPLVPSTRAPIAPFTDNFGVIAE